MQRSEMNNKQKADHTEQICKKVLKGKKIRNKKVDQLFLEINDLKKQIRNKREKIDEHREDYQNIKDAIFRNAGISIKFGNKILLDREEVGNDN